MCKYFPLSSVWGTSDWNEECQCWCRSANGGEYLRHIRSLLSCVDETIMSAETLVPPCLNIWENMRASSTWLATFQHMRQKVTSLTVTSSKQLKGLIIWRARSQCTAVTRVCNMKCAVLAAMGRVLDYKQEGVQGGESKTHFNSLLTLPTFTHPACEFEQTPLSLCAVSRTSRQPSVIYHVFSIHGITFQHEAFEMLPVEILSRTQTPS